MLFYAVQYGTNSTAIIRTHHEKKQSQQLQQQQLNFIFRLPDLRARRPDRGPSRGRIWARDRCR